MICNKKKKRNRTMLCIILEILLCIKSHTVWLYVTLQAYVVIVHFYKLFLLDCSVGLGPLDGLSTLGKDISDRCP